MAIGSGNVFIGDSPKLLEVEPLNLPKLNTPPLTFNRSSDPKSDNSQTSTKDEQSEFTTEEVTYHAQEHHNGTDGHTEPPPLAIHKSSAAQHWQTKKDAADNFPEYFAAHLMGLNAETGYNITEGIASTYETVTDPQKFKQAMVDTAQSLANSVSDPKGTFEAIKKSAVDFANLPSAEQADIAYKTAMGILAGGGVAGKALKSKNKNGNNKHDKDKTQEEEINEKRKEPGSLAEAQAMLAQRREQIAKQGYQPKYSDDELSYIAQHGNIGNDRYQVRFMDTRYLSSRDQPNGHLSGAMGMPMQGATGKGAKYWSTSFDQLEDADTDPKLIAQKLGIEYNPNTDYTLMIVDTEKAAPLTGVKSVPATFEKVGEFANTELPDDFPVSFTNKAMTPEFQAEYALHYNTAVEQGFLENQWSKNTTDFEDYLKTTGMEADKIEDMKLRMKMHDNIGNNQDYIGNGLTKDLNSSSNSFGAVETLNFERNQINLHQLSEADAITVLPGLKPLWVEYKNTRYNSLYDVFFGMISYPQMLKSSGTV